VEQRQTYFLPALLERIPVYFWDAMTNDLCDIWCSGVAAAEPYIADKSFLGTLTGASLSLLNHDTTTCEPDAMWAARAGKRAIYS